MFRRIKNISFSMFLCTISMNLCMEKQKKQEEKIILEKFINYDQIDKSIKELTSFIKKNKQFLLRYVRDYVLPQWREIVTLKDPKNLCAAGSIVAWLSAQSPHSFYYFNGKTYCKIKISIKNFPVLLDICPRASQLAVITSNNHIILFDILKQKDNNLVFDTNESPITAISFYKKNKIALGTADGSVYLLFLETGIVAKMKEPNWSPIISIVGTKKNVLVTHNKTGSMRFYKLNKVHKPTMARSREFDSFAVKGNLQRIAPLGAKIIASDCNDMLYTFDEKKKDSVGLALFAGQLVSLTSNTYVTHAQFFRCAIGTNPVFRLYSSKHKLLDVVPTTNNVQAVFQKPLSHEPKIESFKDLMPLYLVVHEEGENILLIKQKATKKQLAFKFMLALAFEEDNTKAIDKLFDHKIFKSFGDYSRKLFNEVYKEKKYIKTENLLKNQEKWLINNSHKFNS